MGKKDGIAAPLLDGPAELRSGVPVDMTVEMEKEFVTTTDPKMGLNDRVAKDRFAVWGPNELPEKKKHPLMMFLGYFWGPMPIMIWVASAVEFAKGIVIGEGWEDFAVLMVLQFANATIGYIEERNAGDAIAALKNALKPVSHVCRDGKWQNMAARELVPGDLIEVKLGDVVPADSLLLPGQQPMQVDQSALTGESLPVNIHPGDKLKMGSAIKRGEAKAVVVATGSNTFFGKAAVLIQSVVSHGRFQKILFNITVILLVICLLFASIILLYLQFGTPAPNFVKNLSIVIVILVASIPIAIEVVCTSTLAVGSRRLAQKKVIVARLSAIEELAGMSILCSDKTGTLTLNKLSLREPVCMGDMNEAEITFYSALASKREMGNQDAIDFCITQALSKEDRHRMEQFAELDFMPFNPTDKRTEATIRAPGKEGSVFKVTKGAPQVILRMVHNAGELKEKVETAVQEMADRGFRALGMAISYTGQGEPEHWEFQGILSLFDPPRPDTKHTIKAAGENGIEVKMVTGDQTAIAKETCRELGMGTNILNTEILNDKNVTEAAKREVILNAHGFAEVMPEHKFDIVESLRQLGFVTGMTGDGVNDAPALKRADIGIAVFPATDAAKAAADIVLTEPGLSVIIDAIFRSRKIFQRMRNYCIYRISCTLQLLFFFFFAIMTIKPQDASFYGNSQGIPAVDNVTELVNIDSAGAYAFTLPVISLVIITILNDGTMITISHDKVIPEKRPQKWAMVEVTIVSVVLAAIACISSMVMLVLVLRCNAFRPGGFIGAAFGSEGRNYVRWYEARTMMYLKISISDFLTLFSARTRTWFWERRPGYALGLAAGIATASSTLLSLFWDDTAMGKSPDSYMVGLRRSNYAVLTTWIYCILWFLLQDICKVVTYKMLEGLSQGDADRLNAQNNRGVITAMIDEDQRRARLRGNKDVGRYAIGDAHGSATSGEVTELKDQVKKLEKDLAEIKALLKGGAAAPAAAKVSHSGH